MKLTMDLSEVEVVHMLDALGGVVDVLERRSDELVAAVIIRDVMAKVIRAVEEAR